MPLGNISLDPDDPFDKVLFVEQSLQQDGFNAGFLDGKRKGHDEGFNVGIEHGKEVGKEIGFYKGFLETWKLLTVSDGKLKKRQLNLMKQMSTLLECVNYDNPEDLQMDHRLAEIRTKFKQLSSLLRLPVDIQKDSATAVMSF